MERKIELANAIFDFIEVPVTGNSDIPKSVTFHLSNLKPTCDNTAVANKKKGNEPGAGNNVHQVGDRPTKIPRLG